MASLSTKKRKIKHLSGQISSQMVYSNNLKIDKITKTMESQFREVKEKMEQIEERIETEHSLRSTILSQGAELQQLKEYIQHIERKQIDKLKYNYFA